MKAVDALLLAMLGVLAAVAFLNHGSLAVGTDPKGSSFGVGFNQK